MMFPGDEKIQYLTFDPAKNFVPIIDVPGHIVKMIKNPGDIDRLIHFTALTEEIKLSSFKSDNAFTTRIAIALDIILTEVVASGATVEDAVRSHTVEMVMATLEGLSLYGGILPEQQKLIPLALCVALSYDPGYELDAEGEEEILETEPPTLVLSIDLGYGHNVEDVIDGDAFGGYIAHAITLQLPLA